MKLSKFLILMPHDIPQTPVEAAFFLNSPGNTTTQGRRHQISLCSSFALSFLFVLSLSSSVPRYLRGQKLVITKFFSWLQGASPSDTGFLVLPQPLCKGELVSYITQIFQFCSIFRLIIYAPVPQFYKPSCEKLPLFISKYCKTKQFECWVL